MKEKEYCMDFFAHPKKRWTSFQIISMGFASVILIGALLLMLPWCVRTGGHASFQDALFTSTSAVCVTGLVVHDTATYWSPLGQAVILVLIQIGGMGVITVAAAFAMLSGRRINLSGRSTMQEAIAAPEVGGIVRLTRFILMTTAVCEIGGALCMLPIFCRDFGLKGVWMAVFHSVSAFCNAGFDLMGSRGEYSSLVSYVSNPVINVMIMLLIIVGGIGFLTWADLRQNGLHFQKLRLQSKLILITTAILLIFPAIAFFIFEFPDLPLGKRILVSLFQSVTPRTAGFNTVDLGLMRESGISIIIVLMLIGGSPGSTAGGMKTTTAAVLWATAASTFRQKGDPHCFGRRMEADAVKSAATILLMYLVLFFTGGFLISVIEGLPMLPCLFEAASAVGTVGLTLGLTQKIGSVSRLILILLMFCGRVGGLTLVYAALPGTKTFAQQFPPERVTVG
jgi:trk system potassium uptake protein TrkH